MGKLEKLKERLAEELKKRDIIDEKIKLLERDIAGEESKQLKKALTELAMTPEEALEELRKLRRKDQYETKTEEKREDQHGKISEPRDYEYGGERE